MGLPKGLLLALELVLHLLKRLAFLGERGAMCRQGGLRGGQALVERGHLGLRRQRPFLGLGNFGEGARVLLFQLAKPLVVERNARLVPVGLRFEFHALLLRG